MSCSNTVPLLLAIIANTMDAAPRSPAHETNICCRHLLRKGVNSKHTTAGLATNVKNNAIISDGKTTAGSADGNANSPTRKRLTSASSRSHRQRNVPATFYCPNPHFPVQYQTNTHSGIHCRQLRKEPHTPKARRQILK